MIADSREGFASKHAAIVPLDAPEPKFKNELHEPQLIHALSAPRIALDGLRPVAESRIVLVDARNPELNEFIDRFTETRQGPKSCAG